MNNDTDHDLSLVPTEAMWAEMCERFPKGLVLIRFEPEKVGEDSHILTSYAGSSCMAVGMCDVGKEWLKRQMFGDNAEDDDSPEY